MRGGDQSLICAIRGPITLITVGALFALNNFTPYGFHQTWPVILIVFGLLSLLRRAAPGPAGPAPFPPPPYQAAPPYTPPPASGGYRQSHYGEATPPEPSSPGPAKGGFGTSGTPGPTPGQTPGGQQ